MNDFWEENKKKIITVGIIVGITIVITIVNLIISGTNSNQSPEEALEELGQIYYEEIYYPALKEQYADDYEGILSNYSESGMQVTLLTLLTNIENSTIDAFIKNDEESCDLDLTYITIFPKESYDVDDYTIEINLRCDIGFDSEEAETTDESGE